MTSYAVEAEGLVKEYRMGLLGKGKTVRALDGVSLRIKTGELYSILGPNGAGKTTLIKILSTLLLPDSGYARVAGYDVVREADMVRMRIGVVLGGERALYWRLSAWDNLWFFSQLYGIPPGEARRLIRHLLDLVGLAEWANVRVENFSKGMKQRLHIARGLLNDPEVLLLDEPTIGLDPVAAREVRGIVRRVVSEGRTVILTTHYMWEAEELSDRVAIMGGGRILAEGSPEELRSILSAERVVVLKTDGDGMGEEDLKGLGGISVAVRREDRYTVYRVIVNSVDDFIDGLLAMARERGVRLRGLEVRTPSLEDVFVRIAGGLES
ncbi:MAG: ABC transporter ATP-binding protein [Aeropyrum sp.]|nr:ABC transporter ATP-binding protein [Aeropyrum sp.]